MHGLPHFILCHVYILLLYLHIMFTYHCYTCMLCLHITVTHACIVSLFVSYGYSIIVPCSRIHDIWLLPVTDMDILVTGHESCWYAICGIPHLLLYCSRYIVPIILFSLYCSRFPLYCSTLSTELRSRCHVIPIMYSNCSCYIVYLI